MDFNNILSGIVEWLLGAGVRLLISAVILAVSFKLIGRIGRKIERLSDRGRLDKTLARVLGYGFRIAAKLLVAICLIGYVGIDTSGLAALVASVGVGAGLALNGALSNLAGGVLLIITRPFKVDDYIEALGYSGTVEDIHVVCTRLVTPDNKVVYLPNGALSAGNIVNYSEKERRRVDIDMMLATDEDIDGVRELLLTLCSECHGVLLAPEPTFRVLSQERDGVSVSLRLWVKGEDYWSVKYEMAEKIKGAFAKANIKVPHNQLDVHLKE